MFPISPQKWKNIQLWESRMGFSRKSRFTVIYRTVWNHLNTIPVTRSYTEYNLDPGDRIVTAFKVVTIYRGRGGRIYTSFSVHIVYFNHERVTAILSPTHRCRPVLFYERGPPKVLTNVHLLLIKPFWHRRHIARQYLRR